MLIKLIKRDFASTYREFLGLFLAIILATLFFTLSMNGAITNNFMLAMSILLVCAVTIASIVLSIACQFTLFNRNIYSNEGYLTLSLPVKTESLVFSKLLVGSIWILLVQIVAFICIYVFTRFSIPGFSLSSLLQDIESYMGAKIAPSVYGAGIATFLAVFLEFIVIIMEINFCCALAHMKAFKRFKIPAGVAAFFLINYVTQKLSFFFLDKTNNALELPTEMGNDIVQIQETLAHQVNLLLGLNAGIQLIFLAIFFFATVALVKHQLELE